MLTGIGIYRISYSVVGYLFVSCRGSITSVWGRERFFLLSSTCNYVVFVRRGFLFLLVLGVGYIILLWYSLYLPYDYFEILEDCKFDEKRSVFFCCCVK